MQAFNKTNTTAAEQNKAENERALARTARGLFQVTEEAEHIITRIESLLPPDLSSGVISDDQRPVIAYLIVVLHRLKCIVEGKSVSKKTMHILRECRERLFGDDVLVNRNEGGEIAADTKKRQRTATIDTSAAKRLIRSTLNLDPEER